MTHEISEKKIDTLLPTLPYGDEFAWDLHHHVQHCAELMDVSPGLLNRAIGYVSTKMHTNPDDFIFAVRWLLLVLEYVHAEEQEKPATERQFMASTTYEEAQEVPGWAWDGDGGTEQG